MLTQNSGCGTQKVLGISASEILSRAFHDYTESFDVPEQFIQPGSQRSAQ